MVDIKKNAAVAGLKKVSVYVFLANFIVIQDLYFHLWSFGLVCSSHESHDKDLFLP